LKHLHLPLLAVLATLLCAPRPTLAGPYADDMAKCMVNATSPADRTLLVKWLFSLVTLHPDLQSMAAVTPKQRDELARQAAALLQRLLTESCQKETRAALHNEGQQTIEYAFTVLGQVAGRGMMGDPRVAAGARDVEKYLDEKKIKALSAGAD